MKKTILLGFILFLGILFCFTTASAATYKLDGIEYTTIGYASKNVAVTDCDPNATYVDIPSFIITKDGFFFVTTIGKLAFSNCSNLWHIGLPEGITEIKTHAFDRCEALESITLPESLLQIEENAFLGCSLTSIAIPKNVYSISSGAFNSKLEKITVTTDNPYYASIDGVLFDKLSKTLVAYPEGRQQSIYHVPEGIQRIGSYAFSHNKTLENVVLSKTVKEILNGAFQYSNISSISLGGVESIETSAFYGCENLSQVQIPSSCRDIADGAFAKCNITVTVADGNTNVFVKNDTLFTEGGKRINLYFGTQPKQQYIIPDGVETISSYAFCGNKIKDIIFPNTLRVIGEYAFSESEYIAVIDFPNGLHEIGERAFEDCSNLSEVNFQEGVKIIGFSAFAQCPKISSIVLPDGLTEIKGAAFFQCDNLTSIYVPQSVLKIGSVIYGVVWSITSKDVLWIVEKNTYAHQYANENGHSVTYEGINDWLSEETTTATSTRSPQTTSIAIPTPVPTPTATPTPTYTPLKQGNKGDDVLAMKKRLQELGYFSAGAEFSNQYNKTTTERVKLFQKANGLKQTGVADEKTLQLLFSDKAKKNPN